MNWEKAGTFLKNLGRYAMILSANCWRRVAILGRQILIFWQNRKLARTLRVLGTQIFAAREDGEVNPLLTETVKDTLKKAEELKVVKDKHSLAVAALREKSRAAWGRKPGPSPETATASEEPGDRATP